MRKSEIKRQTKETLVELFLDLDGSGVTEIDTGLGFFDHMLKSFAFHAGLDLRIKARGDLNVDDHHTIEDVGICLGSAINEAVGDRRGITRYGWAYVPMDDALARAVLDAGKRPYLDFQAAFSNEKTGDVCNAVFEEFFRAFAFNAVLTLHVSVLEGRNDHHKIEAAFKALGLAFRQAISAGVGADRISSTKGVM